MVNILKMTQKTLTFFSSFFKNHGFDLFLWFNSKHSSSPTLRDKQNFDNLSEWTKTSFCEIFLSTFKKFNLSQILTTLPAWPNFLSKLTGFRWEGFEFFSSLFDCIWSSSSPSPSQSIVGTELFPFNSRSVHVHERNFGHFFKGNSVMNVNGTSVTFSQWTERKSLFIFSVRAEQSSMNSALPQPLS